MRRLYSCLEGSNLGIFESPTGTGKSLSIICGALKWLVDTENHTKESLLSQIAELDEKLKEITEKNAGNWFTEQTEQILLNKEKRELMTKLEALERRTEKRKKYKEKVKQGHIAKKKHKFKSKPAKGRDNETNDSTETIDLLDKVDEDLLIEDLQLDSDGSDEEGTEDESAKYTQIFFCSRTHSQLSQFVGEMKRTPYSEDVSLIPIASRYFFLHIDLYTNFLIFNVLDVEHLQC